MNPTVRAAIWMLGAIVSFSSMAVAGRYVTLELDVFELLFYRSLIGIAILIIIGKARNLFGHLTFRHIRVHLFRNFSHFIGQFLWYTALTLIPLSLLFALEFTAPLWVIVLSPILLGERLTPAKTIAGLLGFLGILIVTQPWAEPISLGVILASLCAIGFAFTAIATKHLTRNESTFSILFYLVTMQAVFAMIGAGLDGDIAFPDLSVWPGLFLIGFSGLFAHFCLTKALSIAPASIVIPIDFLRLPLIAIVGLLLFNEPINQFVILGGLLIFGGNFVNIRANTRDSGAN